MSQARAYPIVVPLRSLTVKPSSACLSATSMSSDRLGDTDQQLVQDRVGDMAAAYLHEHPPGFGCRGVDQLDHGRRVFKRIGGRRESFEIRDFLEAAARLAGA